MLINYSVKEFIEQVDSAQPAPGGGSVAALVGALGVSLSCMYGHLSIGKKAFEQLDETIKNDFIQAFEQLHTLENKLLKLVDEDAKLYPKILASYRLPKSTEEEQKTRTQAIYEATILAIEGPYTIAKCAYEALEQIEILLPYGNKNVISDAACAIVLLVATIETAIINMEINLSTLENKTYKDAIIQLRKHTKEKKEKMMAIAHPWIVEE